MEGTERLEEYGAALKRLSETHPTILFELAPAEMMSIVGGLQLALRHPNFTGPSAQICRKWIRAFQEQIAQEEPVVADVIEMGFNPEFDT